MRILFAVFVILFLLTAQQEPKTQAEKVEEKSAQRDALIKKNFLLQDSILKLLNSPSKKKIHRPMVKYIRIYQPIENPDTLIVDINNVILNPPEFPNTFYVIKDTTKKLNFFQKLFKRKS